jgi:predicted anti-sigma-YlaC factor YlaD
VVDTSGLRCRELVELVTEYLEDVMTPADRRRFDEHLSRCDDCSLYLDQMRRTIRALGELPPERLPDALREELLATFRSWPAG